MDGQAAVTERKEKLCWVAVRDLLKEPPFPPRQSDPALDLLLSSVRLHGVLSPLLVRVRGGRLQVVCGHRRLLAAKASGINEVPALVTELGDVQAIRCYLSENTCRRELTLRGREETLRLMRRLRDGRKLPLEGVEPAGPQGEEGLGAAQEAQKGFRGTRRWGRALSELGVREQAAELECTSRTREAGLPEGSELRKLLKRMRAFLEAVRRTKKADPGRAGSIVAILLGLPSGFQPLSAAQLYSGSGSRETWLAEHSLLCASLAASLAPADAGPEKRGEYALAGLLHDVGMIFLNRRPYISEPRGLNPLQRAEVQTHTRLGHALILSADPARTELARAAREHHEREDGSGYPDGLRGDQVGELSRVVALVDTYASLVGYRPHRNAMRPEVAMERLERATEMGLYDPGLVVLLRQALFSSPVEALL
jgi:HD-GYP domain-containing protein (c-di-GMP phosphodiesterase class II)